MNRRRNNRKLRRFFDFRKKALPGKTRRNTSMNKANLSQASDFSEIENSPFGGDEIQKMASEAGLAAASEAKALGIPKVFARGNKIIREYADGHIEVLVEGDTERTYFRRLKSEIIHARKK